MLFTVVLFLCPLLGLAASLYGDQSPLATVGIEGWLALSITMALVAYTWTLRRGPALDVFEPLSFVSLLFLVVFVIRPLYILVWPSARSKLMPTDPALFDHALLLGACGFMAFYVGYEARLGEILGRSLPGLATAWRPQRLLPLALAFTLLGMGGLAVGIGGSSGVTAFLGNLQGRQILSANAQWLFASLRIFIDVTTALLWANYFVTRRWLPLATLSLLLMVGVALPLGGRSEILVPLLTILVIWYYLRRRGTRRPTISLLSLAVLAVAAGIFVVAFRTLRDYSQAGGDLRALFASSTVDSSQPLPPYLSVAGIGAGFMAEFAQFDWFVVVLGLVPYDMPFQGGRSFLDFFAMFVPRALWADKPAPVAYLVNAAAGGRGLAGTPFTIVGELYLNFGLLGLVLGMALLGVIARMLYAYLRSHARDPGVVLLYAYVFASLHRLFTRSFAPKAFGLVLFIAPALAAIWLIRRKRPSLEA